MRGFGLVILAVVAGLLCCPSLSAAQAGTFSSNPSRFDDIKALGLEYIPGSMPTFYSPHAQARALYLQRLLGGEIEYYSNLFHIPLSPITMAVLNADQWPRVAGADPYGMPSVEGTAPAVFVMPAGWDGVTWMVVPKREQVPSSMLRKALANGRTWDQVRYEGCDGIGTHEIGHSIIHQLEIEAPTRWFNEFLASFVGYAYLKTKAPAQALSSEIFWTVGLGRSPHRFTTLGDFEQKYDELQQDFPANYGWYQLALDQRVIQIYAQRGVEYLKEIRTIFPVNGPRIDSAALLTKLEAVGPGWKVWAADLEAGDVQAVWAPTPRPIPASGPEGARR